MKIIFVTILFLLGGFGFPFQALANGETILYEKWIICQPSDYVNIRSKPTRQSHAEGYLLTGYSVWVNRKKKNGYLYAPEISNELGEGWIYEGYLVDDKPEDLNGEWFRVNGNGRVAARKCIGGKRRCWLKNSARVRVWFRTEEWCVTDHGFIMTRYLEPDSEDVFEKEIETNGKQKGK